MIELDLNHRKFQDDLLNLPPNEIARVVAAFRKIRKLTWEQLYRDKGLRWEAIESAAGLKGVRLYSFRVTQKFRALAYRRDQWLCPVSLHSDHDSAYD